MKGGELLTLVSSDPHALDNVKHYKIPSLFKGFKVPDHDPTEKFYFCR